MQSAKEETGIYGISKYFILFILVHEAYSNVLQMSETILSKSMAHTNFLLGL